MDVVRDERRRRLDVGNKELQTEFSEARGNRKAWGYYATDHRPTYSKEYVEWLESLVIKSRTRHDLALCDDG